LNHRLNDKKLQLLAFCIALGIVFVSCIYQTGIAIATMCSFTCFKIAIELVRANQLYGLLFKLLYCSYLPAYSNHEPGDLGIPLADYARYPPSYVLIGFFSLALEPRSTPLVATSSIIVIANINDTTTISPNDFQSITNMPTKNDVA
jgi:hypothetical protein